MHIKSFTCHSYKFINVNLYEVCAFFNAQKTVTSRLDMQSKCTQTPVGDARQASGECLMAQRQSSSQSQVPLG